MSSSVLYRNLGPLSNVHAGFRNILLRTFLFGVVGSLAMFISSWEKTDRMKDQLFDNHRDYGDTFDFIIVGGGTSGSLLANRLSRYYRVLLLENGGDPHPFQSIPMFSRYMLNFEQTDWMHRTVPQKKACLSVQNGEVSISQGKSLGGTSNLNFMHHTRGSPIDYDNWAELIGDDGWSYDALLPYFKKHEEFAAQGPWSREDHGFNGDLRIETPDYTGMATDFISAGKEMGYKRVDLNGQFSEGFDTASYVMKRGYRQATFSSFIKSIRPRWNLVISKYSHVNKILMRNDNGTETAYGVEYDRHGKRKFAYAKKEIILSAGAIESPKLLMLSGIGPKEHLEELSIPVKADLPVGKNFQDHLHTFLGPFIIQTPKSLLVDRDITSAAFTQFASIHSRGPLTTTGIMASGLVTSPTTKKSLNGEVWPDLQLTMYGIATHDSYPKDMSHAFNLKAEMTSKYFESSKGKDSFSVIVSGGRPESRGIILLQDTDPYTMAKIDPNYLDKESDVDVMIDGIEMSLALVENTTTFQKLGAKFTSEILPGCESYLFRSEAYWECYIRHFSISMGHIAGTVPMGGALDAELRVLGVDRLRVIDASVMPTIVGSGTQAATLVIGEKGADLIIQQWGMPNSKEWSGKLYATQQLTNSEESQIASWKNPTTSKFTESKFLFKSSSGVQPPATIDSSYIYNNVPTSEKPTTIKHGRSPLLETVANSFNQNNSLVSGDQNGYSVYFPTERRPVVHIRDRNIPTQTPSKLAAPVKPPKNYHAARAMENFFSEITSSTTEEPEDSKLTDSATNRSPTTTTGKAETVKVPSNEDAQPQYVTYPIEILSTSYSSSNHDIVVEKGNQIVPDTTTPGFTASNFPRSRPPVYFSRIPTAPKPVNSYKYATNQILRETMPLLSQRNKQNPIVQYQQHHQDHNTGSFTYSYAERPNAESLRDNVDKYLRPDQTMKVAGQNSIIFSNNHPVNFKSFGSEENKEGLRHSVFRILSPNSSYESSTTEKPNPFKDIFAPFSKLLQTPLKFVRDPIKFVSDPLKFITGHVKLVTDPLSRAVPSPFSKVIQAPINFMERIHSILNSNKRVPNFTPSTSTPSSFGGFGKFLLKTTDKPEEAAYRPQAFSLKVTDAAMKQTSPSSPSHTPIRNFKPNKPQFLHHLYSNPQPTTQIPENLFTTNNFQPVKTPTPQNSFNTAYHSIQNIQYSASTPEPHKIHILDNPPVSSTTFNYLQAPPTKPQPVSTTTTSYSPTVPRGYGVHHTSINNTFDYGQFLVNSDFSVSSSERPPKDYELVESDSFPVGQHSILSHPQPIPDTQEDDSSGNLDDQNLKIIYQRPVPEHSPKKIEYTFGKDNEMGLYGKLIQNFEDFPQKPENKSSKNIYTVNKKPHGLYEIIPQGSDQPVEVNLEHIIQQIPQDIYDSPAPSKFVAPQMNFGSSQILKVNGDDKNEHLPEDVKKLLKAQNVDKDTQVYVLLSDQQDVGENFENIPNFKDILNTFPAGTEVKSLLSPQSPYAQPEQKSEATSQTSVQTNLENPSDSKSYQHSSTQISTITQESAPIPQTFQEPPWTLEDSPTSSTDNPALSFKIQILKPKK